MNTSLLIILIHLHYKLQYHKLYGITPGTVRQGCDEKTQFSNAHQGQRFYEITAKGPFQNISINFTNHHM